MMDFEARESALQEACLRLYQGERADDILMAPGPAFTAQQERIVAALGRSVDLQFFRSLMPERAYDTCRQLLPRTVTVLGSTKFRHLWEAFAALRAETEFSDDLRTVQAFCRYVAADSPLNAEVAEYELAIINVSHGAEAAETSGTIREPYVFLTLSAAARNAIAHAEGRSIDATSPARILIYRSWIDDRCNALVVNEHSEQAIARGIAGSHVPQPFVSAGLFRHVAAVGKMP
jgi:hypothetical protein